MNFAVIGLGSFGIKRAQAIKKSKVAKLKAIFDVNNQNLENHNSKIFEKENPTNSFEQHCC